MDRPGDYILNRYMPDATDEEREVARENLKRFARFLVRVHLRLSQQNPQEPIRAEGEDALESESSPL
jgi:hypothetical protein